MLLSNTKKSRLVINIALTAFAVFVALLTIPTKAAPIASNRIKKIEVIGNQRIEQETIEAYTNLKVGSPINDQITNSTLKTLHETDLFADVNIETTDDGTVLISVKENPIVNNLEFEGNKKISSDTLKTEMQLKTKGVYTKEKLKADLDRIQMIYNKSGRFKAQIIPKVVELKDNRIDVVFEIDEGRRSEVKEIFLLGNKNYTSSELEDILSTRKNRWYKIFFNATYDLDKVQFDSENLRKFYANRGYADFKMESNVSHINKETNNFMVTFVMEEGIRYKINNIEIINQIKDLDTTRLHKKIKIKKGEYYNEEKVNNATDKISEAVANMGFAFNDVDVQLKRNKESKTLDIELIVKEGRRVYVNRIIILGNTVTADNVIRREMIIKEGDAYNLTKIKRSKQRIENLGYFSQVDIQERSNSIKNEVDLEVTVKEQSTGQINFSVGYSTFERLLANIQVNKSNFLGYGYDVSTMFQVSKFGQQISAGFTNPYFLNTNLAVGLDVFASRSNNSLYSSFRSRTQGFTTHAGYLITDNLTHSFSFTYRDDEIQSFPNFPTSIFITEQEGRRRTYQVGQAFMYDKRNNRRMPTKGYFIRVGQNYAAFNGENQFMSYDTSTGIYIPTFSEEWVLNLAGRGGTIKGINGKPVNIAMRYSLGGFNLRGFQFNGVGPRIADLDTSGNPILNNNFFYGYRGNNYYSGTVEYFFPTPVPKEFGFKTSVFMDFGSLWGFDGTKNITLSDGRRQTILDDRSVRASAGLSLMWTSPMGPIGFSWAKPIKKQPYDITQTFLINFGSSNF